MTAAAPLPGILAEIEEIAGRDAAVALAVALGGESVHVPRTANLSDNHPVVCAAGWAAARAIAERHAGECLYVPMARRALARILCAQGRSVAEISRLLRISKSAARRYRK